MKTVGRVLVLGELHVGAQWAQQRQEQLAHIRDLLTYTEGPFPDRETTEIYGQVKSEWANPSRKTTFGSPPRPASSIFPC